MAHQPWRKNWLGRVVTIAATLIILTAGFCLFGHAEDGTGDHGMPPDLCAAVLVSSLGLVFLTGVLVNGYLVMDSFRPAYVVSLHIPDPPPKSSLS